jgi:hypothetical protein
MSFRFSRFLSFKYKAAKNGQPKKQGGAEPVDESPKVETSIGSDREEVTRDDKGSLKDTELSGNQASSSKDPSGDGSNDIQDGRADPPGEKSGL